MGVQSSRVSEAATVVGTFVFFLRLLFLILLFCWASVYVVRGGSRGGKIGEIRRGEERRGGWLALLGFVGFWVSAAGCLQFVDIKLLT